MIPQQPDHNDRDDVIVCRCQEVSRGEIAQAIRQGAHSLRDVKLRTEAMMGLCQGRTCQREVARMLAMATGAPLAALLPRCPRPPVRPVPLAALASGPPPANEHAEP